MTEIDIEIRVERRTTYIDTLYMRGEIGRQERSVRMTALEQWADDEYSRVTPTDLN